MEGFLRIFWIVAVLIIFVIIFTIVWANV